MELIEEKLSEISKRIADVDFLPEVSPAPEDTGADYASNVAMKLFGQIKSGVLSLNLSDIPDLDEDDIKSPRDLAMLYKDIMAESSEFPFEVDIAGPGFLNFISKDEYWKTKLTELSRDFDKNISQYEYSGQQVICEFSDPNPFKVLHVGHLYTSIVGDAISRLVEFSGGKVIRANFGGDVGLHTAKTIYAMQKNNITVDDLRNLSDIEKIASAYVDGTRAYEEDSEAKEAITKLNQTIYEIAEAGPKKDWSEDSISGIAALYWRGRELSYAYFDDFYEKVGVHFDKYYPESTVAKRGLSEVKSHIGDVYQESDGAIIFPGEKYGLHTRVFINKNGLPTYEAKDVGLIFTKWDDYHFDKSIVITGNDIIDYMRVVLCSVGQFAPDLPARTKHITHGNVRLPGNEKMSSRKGNFIKAIDVLDDVKKHLESMKDRTDGSDSDGDPKNDAISMAAIKYAFLKYKIGGNIEFDVKESVSMTGNSGVYLQYSGVRAKKVLSAITTTTDDLKVEWKLDNYEKSLIREISRYKDVLKEAVEELAPHKIANYLYELAQEFSRFYEHVKVVDSEYESERAQIVRLYLDTLQHGLNILGISIPDEM